MALISRLYFNAVFGALGGLLGWMLFGVLGERNPSEDAFFLIFSRQDVNVFLGGALIGGLIGYFVVSVEAIRDRSLVRFARLASYGAVLAAVGGALGMWVGDWINLFFLTQSDNPLIAMFARGVGWSLLGVAIGASEGIAARSLGKFSYGMLGGAIGGFVGGMLFQMFYALGQSFDPVTNEPASSAFWTAVGLMILGACIGSLSALVKAVFQPASVKVMRGWQEGREYPLEKPASLLGREEHADIALFRDMKIEKRHAYIRRDGARYILVNNQAPANQTLVNEKPIPRQIDLQDGDRIQLGNVILRFQLRAAVNRQRKATAPMAAVPVVSPKPTRP